jgi:hypothetical protein
MKLDFLQQNSTTSQLCFIEKMKSVKGSIQQMLPLDTTMTML